MAGAVFGEVRMSLFLAGAVFGEVQESTNVSYVIRINHGSQFPWQGQQSVIL